MTETYSLEYIAETNGFRLATYQILEWYLKLPDGEYSQSFAEKLMSRHNDLSDQVEQMRGTSNLARYKLNGREVVES